VDASPISHGDVTTTMGMLADIQQDVRIIRELLEDDDDGEQEAPEDDG
jgi:C4-type Zn-finger protein